MTDQHTHIAIIGAGIIGISTAYYLKKRSPHTDVTLIDFGQPMALTSAQSGENYRNWWPHPIMRDFTNHSIDLMEEIAMASNNIINMNRRGYILATREENIEVLLAGLQAGYAGDQKNTIRLHERAISSSYYPPVSEEWKSAPAGVDVLSNQDLIHSHFPWYDPEIRTILHIRRGGDISGQQMGQYMLEQFRAYGGKRVQGKISQINGMPGSFSLYFENSTDTLNATHLVNAAGPFVRDIAKMLGEDLPVHNVLHQKIAFEDKHAVINRRMPFSIDLDAQMIDWSDEEKEWINDDPDLSRYAAKMPGAIHCRPDGGDHGTWIKLGWAFNEEPGEANLEPELSDVFPEIVLRGASRLNPSLKQYYGRLPRNMTHYGGYYTMTEENWPLVGPMKTENCFIVGAMSGFGTMSACAAGDIAAAWISESDLPEYASALSFERYDNDALMKEILSGAKGVL